ncbi:ATP-grasp domain-containing protein [Thermococcus sp.]
MRRRILITGSGGIGGANFVRALREGAKLENEEIELVGTDYNSYHLELPDLDYRYQTPKHTDPKFLNTLLSIIRKHKIEFLHPHPSVEARVVSENKDLFKKEGVLFYLPRPVEIAPDKEYVRKILSERGIPVPKTVKISQMEDVDRAFSEMNPPLWIRAVRGAGGRLSLMVRSPEEAKCWIKLNVMQKRANVDDFIIHEYLPGRDIAFDSLWYKGKLITSYSRARLEYPLRHISLSGITGTPSVAITIEDDRINKIGEEAVKALSPEPHGFYSVDIKEDAQGRPFVTEVDGKWHTTAPLWGLSFAKINKINYYNLTYVYIKLGYNEQINYSLPKYNLYPAGYTMVRQMDCGVIILGPEGEKWRIV